MVGIGLGVGLGIIGLIAFYVCIHLLLKRRNQRKGVGAGAAVGGAGAALAAEKSMKNRPTSGESFQSAVSHSRFDFEQPDGTLKAGWESLFGRNDRLMVGSDPRGGRFPRQVSIRSLRRT